MYHCLPAGLPVSKTPALVGRCSRRARFVVHDPVSDRGMAVEQ